MKSHDIRSSFLDFFAQRGHKVHPSAPLVPHGDATLLFTNAGMVPFKSYFLGAETPEKRRAASAQKCLRVSGKHNDLENVGPSPRHHTFFEMLGNFSFGDYFKEEAIEAAWELVTQVWGLPVEHLYATVFHEDDEAHDLWGKISSLPAERILRCGAKDNFWAMGETGPCGPCSEIFVDARPGEPAVDWEEGSENGRYLEIWNLVFMQFDRDASGEMTPLPKPSIDTGAGLERLAAVLQGVPSNYDTDLFRPILDAAATLAGTEYTSSAAESDTSLRVVADHLRAVSFLLADGVIPSNEGRGYVLRRILRRALRHGMRLGLEEPFLHRLVPVVGEVLGSAYGELGATQGASVATVRAEEEKFLSTVATGARQVQQDVEDTRREGGDTLTGSVVFRLYDTYGLPLEVIREIAEEERMGVDEAGFETALAEQRQRSRAAAGDGFALLQELRRGADLPDTDFVGYGELELTGAEVLETGRETADGDGSRAERGGALAAGREGVVALDRTVFYAESGGQVGDRGEMTWGGPDGTGRATVVDTQKDGGVIFHRVRVEEGELRPGSVVDLRVDAAARRPTERNHTATHLLHAALQEVLGDGVRQAGSLVAADRLRFDFTYPQPVTADERRRIEDRVNEAVREATATDIVAGRSREEALEAGAMALFGEKYGDTVRTVEIPSRALPSLELCGGCHVGNTGEIGLFVLTAERGIASGVRRIEALTGQAAFEHLRERSEGLARTEERLGVPAERVDDEIDALREAVKERDRELAKLRLQLVSGSAGGTGAAGEGKREVAGVAYLAREVPWAPVGELRNMADTLRSKMGSGVVVLGSRGDGKVSLLAAVSDDLKGKVHAGKLVGELARKVGGGGGGRPDFAQAGGREPDKLPDALDAVPAVLEGQLG